jgi:membrane protease YdiL (CAAX protease family)
LFALSVLIVFLAPVVEELFFRGLLLPRMQKVCGRFDWIVNGTIFTAYHLHEPWVMPTTVLTGIFGQAYPAKRFRSIWISIVAHTLPSFLMIGIILSLVLE